MSDKTLVLITPARNEEKNIRRLIECVTGQTFQPLRWAIVSDNSTDATDEIVESYAKKFPYIHLVRPGEGSASSSMASMAGAVTAGYDSLKDLEFSFVAKIDADISIEPDCLEILLGKCIEDESIGRLGPTLLVRTENRTHSHLSTPNWHVSGGLEMFRRECYEQIGGLKRLSHGGTDTVADIMSRMNGWKVVAFTDVKIVHHGPVGEVGGSMHKGRFHHGMQDYTLGYHPIFFAMKLIRRLVYKPYVLGSVQQGLGFLYAIILRLDYAVDDDVVRFLRDEQKSRLKDTLRNALNRVRGRTATC